MLPDFVQPPTGNRPDEHPTFHRNSMLGFFALMVCLFLFGGLKLSADSFDEMIPDWIPLLLMLAAFAWMLYRALFATPCCPSCRAKQLTRLEVYKEIVGKDRNPSRWRRFRCNACDKEFIVPGMSMDG